MKEITKGKASLSEVHNNAFGKQVEICIKVKSKHFSHVAICAVYDADLELGIANAELIAEAFNVTNETGFSPRQLADQKAELLEALMIVKDYIDYPGTHKGTTRIRKAVEKALKNSK